MIELLPVLVPTWLLVGFLGFLLGSYLESRRHRKVHHIVQLQAQRLRELELELRPSADPYSEEIADA